MLPVYFYDPTLTDSQSKVRGVGRYLQQLRLALEDRCHFVPRLSDAPFDSILVHSFFHLLQEPGLPLRRTRVQVAIMHDVIVQKYPHHFPIGYKGILRSWVNWLDLQNYQYILTDTEVTKSDIHRLLHVSTAKIHIFPPPLPPASAPPKKISSSLAEMTRLPYVIYVGDVTWNKNIAQLARALSKVPVRVLWVGKTFTQPVQKLNPWHREYAQWKEVTYKDPNSITTGYVTDAELTYLYEHAICNMLVSRDEGFGYSYAEAARCATPSVLSDVPVFHEVAQDTALFAPPDDAQAIAASITRFMHDSKLQKRLGLAAQKRAADFDTSVYVDTFIRLLNTIQKRYA